MRITTPLTSGCNDEPVVVNPAAIQIVKTADAAQVNAGDQIGFTMTVYNTGSGDAKGVTLTRSAADERRASTGRSRARAPVGAVRARSRPGR